MKKIDGRGLECPKPVILIKKALDDTDEAAIIVDNDIARDNIKRFAKNGGFSCTVVENEEGITLFLKKTKEENDEHNDGKLVVLIKSNLFGEGDIQLGNVLMKSFLVSLLENNKKVKSIIFMNKGIELTTTNVEIIEILKEFEQKGTEIFSCGTCLDFYGVKDDLKIGQITNMYASVDALVESSNKILII